MENKTELKSILENLKKEIPYKWRVQSFSKHKPQATCVAYIDSRDVQDLLDANCEWSDRYYSEGSLLFCEITIYADGREYKRSDTGSESNVEKDKGHSSDAFKRAAVKFGVGRFLYSLPVQYVSADAKKTSSNYPNVIDSNGKKVWDVTKHINSGAHKSKPTQTTTLSGDRKLRQCKNLQDLKTVYTSLSPTEQKAWVVVKDEMKDKLSLKSA